ncbi:MAG: hypothetical protein SH868_05635 [Bythopirellula sp.]|nr:hypothetical protein [Bythopirellula sp.]
MVIGLHKRALLFLVWAALFPSLGVAQHLDVLVQVADGQVAIGGADYDSGTWTIGQRVFQRQLLSNFRANDPGFTGLATGNALLESGVTGFPANHNIYFDLLPMRIGSVKSNLFFWNGTDLGGNGLGVDDVQFILPPAGVTWNIFDDGFNLFTAAATDTFVPGGLLQQTSSDTNPGDGINTGTLHGHLLMRVDDGDGNTQTTPPQGVYMAALQVRAAGFETSDPFLFVHRTSSVSNVVRDLATEWADLNYDSLFGLPGDFDQDGDVDGRDFLAWQRGESPLSWSPDDLAEWQGSFGTGPLLASFSGIPEPTSLSLAGGSLVLGLLWRTRGSRI